jgi:hypothetical protein
MVGLFSTFGGRSVNSRHVCQALIFLTPWFASSLLATTPLFDQVDVAGQNGDLFQKGQGWLDLPPSDSLQRYRREANCSAIGGPRGEYRVVDGRLWLYGLYPCRGKIALADVYIDQHQPMFSDWITGDLVAIVGNVSCPIWRGTHKNYHNEISIRVERGSIKMMQGKSKTDLDDCRLQVP